MFRNFASLCQTDPHTRIHIHSRALANTNTRRHAYIHTHAHTRIKTKGHFKINITYDNMFLYDTYIVLLPLVAFRRYRLIKRLN